ncbi:imidazoleglycerol-phosphate dehydratase HisB [Dethiobacter alkaliphilus]|uniref:imidazoleglycerol-phosphate dehydratase HisB n=1 Tax=Dethiobacter alkaliphilus TaxID=427926 RepID=UPI0022261D08|nr:imidazoleglycerol-phosphate dehydratase HisB [Dethiobacter alkaliphilus]MCW3491290.1 imidazoleglycerol-phosphate dehydratase HisB [Dethiobacter alkaliphilus]
MKKREAVINRKTGETEIELKLELDGQGRANLETGVPFFEHMLTLFSRHGFFDLEINAEGDLPVDAHHLVEDVGLVLGDAFDEALGDKAGIRRYGSVILPMDEALVLVAVDLSGRPYLGFELPLGVSRLGNFETELVEEFLRAFVNRAKCTLHVRLLTGTNTHHIVEAAFKGLGRALDEAVGLDPRVEGIPSTKGVL